MVPVTAVLRMKLAQGSSSALVDYFESRVRSGVTSGRHNPAATSPIYPQALEAPDRVASRKLVRKVRKPHHFPQRTVAALRQLRPVVGANTLRHGLQTRSLEVGGIGWTAPLLAPGSVEASGVQAVEADLVDQADYDVLGSPVVAAHGQGKAFG